MAILSFVLGLLVKDKTIVIVFILIACFYQFTRSFFYIAGALLWKRRQSHIDQTDLILNPQVSILIPCFNEQDVIERSLRNLEKLTYKNKEIIIIDDGSTDETYDLAQKYSKSTTLAIKVLTQTNAGKANALNTGIAHAQGEYVFCADADSLIDPLAIDYGLRALQRDSSLAAVAGSVRVLNPSNLIQIYQELEYSIGDVQKSFLGHFGLVNIIPGPAGLFRKSVLEKVGGYETEEKTFAEDTELTLRILSEGYKITFEPRMFSVTEAPQDIACLIRQRYRWNRGIYQALRKNINLLVNRGKDNFSTYLIFEKIWTPIVDFCLLTFLIGQFICSAKIDLFVSYNLFIFSTEIASLAAAHILSKRSQLDYVLTLLISRFTLSPLITTWKFLCLQEEWGKIQMTWDKLDRQKLRAQGEHV